MEWYRKSIRIRVAWVALAFAAIVAVMASCGSTGKPAVKPSTSESSPRWQVYFSPNGGATDAIVRTIGGAKKGILVQAYSFTSQPIARALLNATKRGVGVKIILDKSQVTQKYSSADFFKNVGMVPLIDHKHTIAHNKVMIIDGTTVITGSFNFTKAAEQRNAENLLIIRDAKLAAVYAKNWELHRKHSKSYTGKAPVRRGNRVHAGAGEM